MMKVVIPERVEIIAAAGGGTDQLGSLGLVLGHDDRRPAARGGSYLAPDGGDDVIRRGVEEVLRRVQAQPVEVILLDPVAGIGEEELAHGLRSGAVEIERVTPLCPIAIREVAGREVA